MGLGCWAYKKGRFTLRGKFCPNSWAFANTSFVLRNVKVPPPALDRSGPAAARADCFMSPLAVSGLFVGRNAPNDVRAAYGLASGRHRGRGSVATFPSGPAEIEPAPRAHGPALALEDRRHRAHAPRPDRRQPVLARRPPAGGPTQSKRTAAGTQDARRSYV